MRRVLLTLLVTAFLGGGFTAIAVGSGHVEKKPPDPGVSTAETPLRPSPPAQVPVPDAAQASYLRCTSVEQALNFPNFWAGDALDALSVSAVIRRCDLPQVDELVRANYVSYLYGDCIPDDDEGCAPPIEVQTWPASERNKETITPAPFETQVPGTDTTISGFPATWYEEGKRLEIYRPNATVVIFGDETTQISRFAAAMMQGPAVLTELSAYGIVFARGCTMVEDPYHCVAGQ